MMSQLPTNFEKVSKDKLDREICRAGMVAELDAVSFYEQMSALAVHDKVREVLLDIAKEEKTHMGEFQALLLKLDKEQEKELVNGKKEVGLK